MNEETLNLSIRTFLTAFGLQGQHQIDQAVAQALASGAVSGSETFPGTVTPEIPGRRLNVEFKGEIALG